MHEPSHEMWGGAGGALGQAAPLCAGGGGRVRVCLGRVSGSEQLRLPLLCLGDRRGPVRPLPPAAVGGGARRPEQGLGCRQDLGIHLEAPGRHSPPLRRPRALAPLRAGHTPPSSLSVQPGRMAQDIPGIVPATTG